jgi:hypothetical protein
MIYKDEALMVPFITSSINIVVLGKQVCAPTVE